MTLEYVSMDNEVGVVCDFCWAIIPAGGAYYVEDDNTLCPECYEYQYGGVE